MRHPRIALVDSGIGLLAAAAAVRRLRPDASLVISNDPEGMPWGPRTPADITARTLALARAAVTTPPDALIVACNTATVSALPQLRAELEPAVPVVGTVPAVKPAAAAGRPLAVWATQAATESAYQRDLLDRYAAGLPAVGVPCHGLADAVERADEEAVEAAVRAAAALTPPETRTVVLGCTHYELVADRIRRHVAAVTGAEVTLIGSADAVAAQALRRAGLAPHPTAAPGGTLEVFASTRPAALPEVALAYPEGRLVAAMAGTPASASLGPAS
ncbi:glutamate racemase [Streptomyces millisiae]|uniref:Aspartate/glutamate racemase family protein n=1 Tax=Streptomyces millisiae TaxID=3075542 RepID=A0ABU2LHN0_9ACTN|nr:aspartate/glutamate racemase family protein [Streptomyces sp. DSM 44918]MDT0316782.1 aspartate/glutamate racemase family protein [Streptomyces sp. DSM 44918]